MMAKKKSATLDRKVLLLLWSSSFLLNLGFLLYLYLSDNIELRDLTPSLKTLSTVYAPYLGAILTFYWGGNREIDESAVKKIKTPFYAAIGFSLVWNLIILQFLFPLILLRGNLEDSIEGIETVSSTFSWLVAGAIGFYFAKVSNEN